MTSPVCSIEGCERPHYARSWCAMHWFRWYRRGSTDDAPRATHRTKVTPWRYV